MKVTLKEINKSNFRDCFALKVSEDQQKWVGSNENSLAMSKFYPSMKTLGIFDYDTMVGFIMYDIDDESHVYYINRFMIDYKHQKNGYGTQALKILTKEIKDKGEPFLEILCKADNFPAQNLYKNLGFEFTGEIFNDDQVLKLTLI
jgi:diamine N-acetyltransferase